MTDPRFGTAAAFAVVLLAATVPCRGQDPQAPPPLTAIVTVGHGRAMPGADATVSIAASSASPLGAMQLDLDFDQAAARVETVAAGSGWPAALVEWRVTAPGHLRIAAANPKWPAESVALAISGR